MYDCSLNLTLTGDLPNLTMSIEVEEMASESNTEWELRLTNDIGTCNVSFSPGQSKSALGLHSFSSCFALILKQFCTQSTNFKWDIYHQILLLLLLLHLAHSTLRGTIRYYCLLLLCSNKDNNDDDDDNLDEFHVHFYALCPQKELSRRLQWTRLVEYLQPVL